VNVLVVNAGSSSLKYRYTDTATGETHAHGTIERIGTSVPDHRAALAGALERIPIERVEAVGHRVVHGGERFREATLLTEDAIDVLAELTPLAPLHNPPALQAIHAAQELLPGVPMVGVFDTAFHATIPRHAYLYAIPHRYYEEYGVRRYGFHGTSHAYVAREAARLLEEPAEKLRLVTLHLGNGASACAVLGGRSIDTTMGFTPLEGLVMGTRSGDLDPALPLWLAEREGHGRAGNILNRESGLLGLSGVSNDLRDVHRAHAGGNSRATDALLVMTYRLVKTVGAYAAALGGLDALVFTGGIGEHDTWVRAEVTGRLAFLGLHLDEDANARHATFITRPGTRPAALVIPTDEEGEIARQTRELLGAAHA